MRSFRPARLSLDERLAVDATLDEAFAPLRARGTRISPARARAAVRWSAPEPRPLRGLGLLTRVSKLTVAAAVSAFLFAGSVASVEVMPSTADLSRDAVTAGDWMLNGRNALQRPIDSRATDYRTTAGDLAANAATTRRASVTALSGVVRDSEPFPARP